ncbi:MAG: hypothetical protein JNJ54_25920 [Myxococcaceae bacterium]|nr:hypothetical protein [Myxococcaceae bacterium]
MDVRLTVASCDTHERLVVEVETGADRVLSLCRVSKEQGAVMVEFDLRWQGGGGVSVPLEAVTDALQNAKAELDLTYP